MMAWTTAQHVILLIGCLVLAFSALRSHQLNARKWVTFALLWGAIFLAVATVFGAVG